MKIGVVIVTYNRLELLKECICCVESQSVSFNKIFVINNASTDSTAEYLSHIHNQDIEIISLDRNIGGAGGFYVGIETALNYSMDWILLIDDDAMLDKDFNKNIINNVNVNHEILAYSGTVITDNVIDLNHRRHLTKKNRYKERPSLIDVYKAEFFDYYLASFCGLMISSTLIKRIGLPKKDFFIWYDDTEYSLRINRETIIRNINNAKLNHKTKLTGNNDKISWKHYYGVRNQIYILKQYFNTFDLFKFLIHKRLSILKSDLLYFITRNENLLYKSTLFKDALRDGLNSSFGINSKYLP